ARLSCMFLPPLIWPQLSQGYTPQLALVRVSRSTDSVSSLSFPSHGLVSIAICAHSPTLGFFIFFVFIQRTASPLQAGGGRYLVKPYTRVRCKDSVGRFY